MNVSSVRLRPVSEDDRPALAAFRCSAGAPWEDAVEQQIRGPLPHRYLAVPSRFDGRMLVGCDLSGRILVVGAHHIEPTLVPDVGYTEVVAVALDARGTLVGPSEHQRVSLGEFML